MYGRNDRKYDDRSRGRSPDRDYRRRDDDRRYGDQEYRSSRERSRDRHDDDRGRSRRSDSRTRFDDSFRSQPQPPPPQQQYQQGQFGGYVPPQPHFRQGMQPMSAYAPPQQQHQPPQQQHMYMQPNQAFQQQPPPQHYVPQQGTAPLGIPGSSFVPQQTMGLQQPPQMGQPYVATLQQQQQPPLMGNQLQQSLAAANVSSYGAPAPGTWQSQSMPSTQTIPADILALADKASSAVQFLQASRSLSQPVVNNMPQMQIPTQLNSFSYSNPVPSSQPPPNRRGRTTATMNELPVTVQYAVQVRIKACLSQMTFAFC